MLCRKTRKTGKRGTIPKGLLDALDIILAKIPLRDLFLTNRDAVPCESEGGAVAALVEDKSESRVVSYTKIRRRKKLVLSISVKIKHVEGGSGDL